MNLFYFLMNHYKWVENIYPYIYDYNEKNLDKMKKDEFSGKDLLEHYSKIQTFAQTEIERVYKIFKTLIWTVSIVFTVGVAIAALVIGKSVSEIKDKYERSVEV